MIDIIIFSPPFAEIEPFQDKNFVIGKRRVGDSGSGDSYSNNKADKGNLANLKYGGFYG